MDNIANSHQYKSSHHIIAAIGTIIILPILPIFLYFALLFTIDDVGGPLNLVILPCSNFVAAFLFTVIIFFLSKNLSKWPLQNGKRVVNSFLLSGFVFTLLLALVFGVFFLAVGIILESQIAFGLIGRQDIDSVTVWLLRFMFLGGVPFLLGGATYWLLLQATRKTLSNS